MTTFRNIIKPVKIPKMESIEPAVTPEDEQVDTFLDSWEKVFPGKPVEDVITSFTEYTKGTTEVKTGIKGEQTSDVESDLPYYQKEIDSFLNTIQATGKTQDTLGIVKTLFPDVTEQDVNQIFAGSQSFDPDVFTQNPEGYNFTATVDGKDVQLTIKPDATLWMGTQQLGNIDLQTGDFVPVDTALWKKMLGGVLKGLEIINKPMELSGRQAFKTGADPMQLNFEKEVSQPAQAEVEKLLSENGVVGQVPPELQPQVDVIQKKYEDAFYEKYGKDVFGAQGIKSRYNELSLWEQIILELPANILGVMLANPAYSYLGQLAKSGQLGTRIAAKIARIPVSFYEFGSELNASEAGAFRLGGEGAEKAGKLTPDVIEKLKALKYTDEDIALLTVKNADDILKREIKGDVQKGEEFFRDPKNNIEPLKGTYVEPSVVAKEGAIAEKVTQGIGNIPPVKPPVTTSPMDDIVKKVTAAITDAKPAREMTEQLKHEELSKRVAVAARQLEQGIGSGETAFKQSTKALSGLLPQDADYVMDLAKFGITDEDIKFMFDSINKSPKLRYFQKLNTAKALGKLLIGQIPTSGEILRLEKMFGTELTKALVNKLSPAQKALRVVAKVLNIPRTLLTIGDFSATLRQGVLLAAGQPIEFKKAFVNEMKTVFSEKNYKELDEIIHNMEFADEGELHNLYLAPIETSTLTAKEEAFMGNILEKVPGLGSIVRASERAYNSFLNTQRMEVWSYWCRKWEGTGKTFKDYDNLASFINHATGRGDLGKLENAGVWLNAAFFSPKWIVSRVQVPLDLITSTPAVRKVIARNLIAFWTTGMSALGLAALAGAEVENDPRSADFGKIKIGNTRIDFWGGYLPYIRLVTQLTLAERKITATGATIPVDRQDILNTFLRSKLAPIPGLAWDLGQGKTFIGEELTAENAPTLIYEKLTPMFIQDLTDAINDIGVAGVGYGVLSGLGVGAQTYEDNWNTEEGKLGQPVSDENLPYTIEKEIYTTNDYYSKVGSMIGGATADMLKDKDGVPEKVVSVAEARDIKSILSEIPNIKLTSINTDPSKGDTFEQYYQQSQARKRITDEKELKEFDKLYPDAQLGNITAREYALLKQYNSSTIEEKYTLLKQYPTLIANPRDEAMRTHPEENAKLSLWGQSKVYTQEAYDKAIKMAEDLDIPDTALPKELTEYKQASKTEAINEKWGVEDFIYNEYNNEKLPDYIENDEARTDTRDKFLQAHQDYADDRRRRDAYGYDEKVPDSVVEMYVQYYKLSTGSKRTQYRASHPELYKWGIGVGIWKDPGFNTQTSSVENEWKNLFI
jgi:hypothetical protein